MKNKFSRREVLELGLGSVALIAGSRIASAAGTKQSPVNHGEEKMTESSTYNRYGEELEELLMLRTSPIAVKMLEKESDIPEGTVRPYKDRGQHWAQCQVFSLSRRDRLAVAMLKEDNWCLGPLMAYGLGEMPPPPPGAGAAPEIQYKRFEFGQYVGILTAPLKSAQFEPDLVLVYSDTNQLRDMLMSLKEEEKSKVRTNLFPISCAFCVTNPIIDNEYWVNLPDPGEYVRALTQPGEMIFSIPAPKLTEFMEGLRKFDKESMFAHEQMMMQSDFDQPDIYKQMFEAWGMEHS